MKNGVESRLDNLVNEVQELQKLVPEGEQHARWQLDCVSILRELFGTHSLHENKFTQLTYDVRGDNPPSYLGESHHDYLNRLHAEWYQKDLERASGILKSAQNQIGQKGITQLESEKRLTCFLSHTFDAVGEKEAGEVREFLELSSIGVITGKDYEPRSISQKMTEKLSIANFGVAIISEDKQSLWSRDEVDALVNSGKPVIFLVSSAAEHVQGMFADTEYIQYPAGHISETFTKILQGLRFIKGTKANAA